jgi:uncharacterized protein YecE (DUF72 family)
MGGSGGGDDREAGPGGAPTGAGPAPPSADDGPPLPPALRIGASSWSAGSWEGEFYPKGMRPGDYLAFYAARFDTVEIDATFYRTPDARVVDGWRDRTPPGFVFAAKVPQIITHEKMLEDCGEDLGAFLRVMTRLGDKLGPLLLQFRYFRKAELPDPKPFLDRLERFLPALPRDMRFAVEVRNRSLVTPRLLDLLQENRVALAFIDHPWFHGVDELMKKGNVLTGGFAYVRWLGDRHEIEKRTTRWDRLILDRTREMGAWIPAVRTILQHNRTLYGFFNNHYAGYAIGSIRLFRRLWREA